MDEFLQSLRVKQVLSLHTLLHSATHIANNYNGIIIGSIFFSGKNKVTLKLLMQEFYPLSICMQYVFIHPQQESSPYGLLYKMDLDFWIALEGKTPSYATD